MSDGHQADKEAGKSRPVYPARGVHDPCLIRDGEYVYLFCTGSGVPIRRSRDLVRWEPAGRVFAGDDLPSWAREAIPGSDRPWAPDIALLNGRFHLYYSVSTFGKNRSLIGLATSPTLDPAKRGYGWRDEGKVFESFPQDDYNAIDSHVLKVGRDRLIFTFGSFWGGIQLVEADPATGKPRPGAKPVNVARRPSPGAVEAPFLERRGDWYYLFVSFDFCCRGVNSTYNVRVGRSRAPEGPYVDRDGVRMLDGGGTPVVKTEGSVVGPGHCAVFEDRRHYLAYHFYDPAQNGVPTLQIRPLSWDRDGWPVPGSPLAP